MHDGDLIGLFGLVHVGGRPKHREMLLARKRRNDVPEFKPRERVNADGRLVKHQQFGQTHQRAGKPELLLHAPRELAGGTRRERREVGHRKKLFVPAAALGHRNAVQIGIQVEILLNREILVQAKALGHVADAPLHGLRTGRNLLPEHRERPRIRAHQRADHAQKRGLSGAVRPHKRGNHAAADLEVNAAQSLHGAAVGHPERLSEILSVNACSHDTPGALPHPQGALFRTTVAGCPSLSASEGSSTNTLTSYTKLVRNSSVCTLLGVNSATEEM